MYTHDIVTEAIVKKAIQAGKEAATKTDDQGSNGSEAWQYVQLFVKGQRKLQNELKKIEGVKRDSYYGYLITAVECGIHGYGYYKGEAFCQAVAKSLRDDGIKAYAGDRLL